MLSNLSTNMFPPEATFSVDQIPNLQGQVMIVTGGNTGIGKETVKALLEHNAKVYIAGRDQEKIEEAIEDLRRQTGKEAHTLLVDLADLKSIRAAVADFQARESQLHVLFNSAGVMYPDVSLLTADGFDLQFGTNVVGHFYLTRLLMPILLSTAHNIPGRKVRVINTSSMGHMQVDHIDYDTLTEGPKRTELGTTKLYAQSKFANVVFSNELHRQYADQGVVSISLHPGNLKTDLQRHTSKVTQTLVNPILYPPSMGALTQLYSGTMPEAAELGGKYLIPWARVGEAKEETDDPKVAAELWAWLESQIKGI